MFPNIFRTFPNNFEDLNFLVFLIEHDQFDLAFFDCCASNIISSRLHNISPLSRTA